MIWHLFLGLAKYGADPAQSLSTVGEGLDYLDHDVDHDLDNDVDHDLDNDVDRDLDNDVDHDLDHDLLGLGLGLC